VASGEQRPPPRSELKKLEPGAEHDVDGRVAVSLMMRGFGYPQGTGFDAGVRWLETGVAGLAAHRRVARAGGLGPAPGPEP
jgi:hypothetical protein